MEDILFPHKHQKELSIVFLLFLERIKSRVENLNSEEEIRNAIDDMDIYDYENVKLAIATLAISNSNYVFEQIGKVSKKILGSNIFTINTINEEILLKFIKECLKDYKEIKNYFLDDLIKRIKDVEINEAILITYAVIANWIETKTIQHTGNMYTESTKDICKDFNIGTYIWRTKEDDRVRPTHRELNRTRRTFDESPKPGEEWRCRCWFGFEKEDFKGGEKDRTEI